MLPACGRAEGRVTGDGHWAPPEPATGLTGFLGGGTENLQNLHSDLHISTGTKK